MVWACAVVSGRYCQATLQASTFAPTRLLRHSRLYDAQRIRARRVFDTDRVHTASDVVALLQSACGPEGAGWRGPEGLQLSSHFEAPKFKGPGNHGMELFVRLALPNLKRLRALDLGDNSIGPSGAGILVKGLTGWPQSRAHCPSYQASVILTCQTTGCKSQGPRRLQEAYAR